MRVDPKSKLPVYAQIANHLKSEIRSGRYALGTKLPSARDFADELGVSAPTVTRAYSALDDAGYTQTYAKKGTYIIGIADEPGFPSREQEVAGDMLFMSYSHSDEDSSYGAIKAFKEVLSNEYKLKTGKQLEVFYDRDSIEWGSDWRAAIRDNIGRALFFMPFLSPSYLGSPACVGEYREAMLAFAENGMGQRIVPMLFVDCSNRLKMLEDDGLANAIADKQWENISDLQYEEPTSALYRKRVKEIVDHMVEESIRIDQKMMAQTYCDDGPDVDDEDGVLDAMVFVNERVPCLTDCTQRFSETISEIGNVTRPYSEKLEHAMTFPKKMAVIKEYSNALMQKADIAKECSQEISDGVDAVDGRLAVIFDLQEDSLSFFDSTALNSIMGFCGAISTLDDSAEIGFSGAEGLRSQVAVLGKMSRDLKTPVSKLCNALDMFLSIKPTFKRWKRDANDLQQRISEVATLKENEGESDRPKSGK